MEQVTVKIPRSTYLAVKAAAKKRGCFIGKVIADAVELSRQIEADRLAFQAQQSKQSAAD